MRQKRAKAYKRVMALYTSAFSFRQPYQVLLGTDFLLEAGKQKEIDMLKIVQRTVQGDIKPMITQCCIEALYRLGKEYQPVVDLAKKCERRKCNHRTAIDAFDCIKEVVGETNKHRYVLALQNPKLVSSLNHVPGLPVIHYNARGVMVLAPPGQATVRAKNALEDGRRRAGADLLDGVVDGENVVGAASTSVASSTDVVRTRKVKAKGPNPLSMRKKKAPAPTPAAGGKRKLDDDNDNDDDKEDAPAPGDEDEESRKKKKRKRGRGKGVVAAAIAEIKAGGLGGVITHKEDPPSGDESD